MSAIAAFSRFQTVIIFGGRFNELPLAVAVSGCFFFRLPAAVSYAAAAVCAVAVVNVIVKDVLRIESSISGCYTAVRVCDYTIVGIILKAGSTFHKHGQPVCIGTAHFFLTAFIVPVFVALNILKLYRLLFVPFSVPVPLILKIASSRHHGKGRISGGVGLGNIADLADIILQLRHDIRCAVVGYLHIRHRDDLHEFAAGGAENLSETVRSFERIGLLDYNRRIGSVRSTLDRCTAVLADVPMRRRIVRPLGHYVLVFALGIVIAQFEAAIIGKAIMRKKLGRLYTYFVRTAERQCILRTAVFAQAAVLAEFVLFIAVAAVFADMVIVSHILGAIAVLAMLPAAFAHMTILAQLIKIKAFAAVIAQMLFLFVIIFRADTMVAVIIFLTVLTQSAIFALHVIGTLSALGADVVFIFGRFYTVAVRAALGFAV